MVRGETVSVRDAPLPPKTKPDAATRPVFEEVAVTTSDEAGDWSSPTVKLIRPVETLAVMTRLAMSLIVGAVFAAVTVRTKAVLAERVPSLTVTVIVAEPATPLAGETERVRDAPLPLSLQRP